MSGSMSIDAIVGIHARAAIARAAWEEWLDSEEQFPTGEFLDAVDCLLRACGAPVPGEGEHTPPPRKAS